jgi:predicted permease
MNAVQDGHGLMDAAKKKACNNWGNLGNISIPLMMDTNGMNVYIYIIIYMLMGILCFNDGI